MKRFVLFITLVLLLAFHATALADPRQLWVYCPTNLQVDANVDKLAALFARAHKSGYTHVLLADSKLGHLGDLGGNTQRYFQNLERLKKIATDAKLVLIPAIFDVGYSNGALWHDPNLAEGLPVVDTPLVVKNGELVVEPNARLVLKKPAFVDPTVQFDAAKRTALIQDPADNARFVYKLSLPKFRCYHVKFTLRTKDFTGHPRVTALSGGRELQVQNVVIKPTQDWTEMHVVFDTLDHEDIGVYFGNWGKAKGTLEFKDWSIEEAAFVNVLRRDGTPVVLKDEAGKTLEEGKAYDRIVDPLLGNKPWPGVYTSWHQPPRLKTTLAEGARVRASWYYPPIVYDEQVMICPSEPKTMAIFQDEYKRVNEAFSAPGYMMSHDEIRVMNWCAACTARKMTPGAILADNVRACANLLKGHDVYVWNDMFDPFHNMHDNYYLVNGDLAGAVDGLDKNVIIMNWNFGKRDQSLKFFEDRGHRQIIAGYYDGDLANAQAWVKSATPGVIGFMYTTWQNDYSKLEAFADICRAAPSK